MCLQNQNQNVNIVHTPVNENNRSLS